MPLALPTQVTIQGPCPLSNGGICATGSGYPANNYNSNEVCIISNVPAVPLQVVAFDVEFGGSTCSFDAITVNSQRFCGTVGPSGVVPSDGRILWSSDVSCSESGGEICWGPPPPPM
jgi:hypothetical protein